MPFGCFIHVWKTEVAWNLIVGSSFWENEGEALRPVTEGWPSCWLVELTEAISVHLNADITSLCVVLNGFSEGNIMDVSGIRDISLDSPHASSVSCCFHPSHSQDWEEGHGDASPEQWVLFSWFVYLMGLFLQRPGVLQVDTFFLNIWIALSSMRKLAFFVFWKW